MAQMSLRATCMCLVNDPCSLFPYSPFATAKTFAWLEFPGWPVSPLTSEMVYGFILTSVVWNLPLASSPFHQFSVKISALPAVSLAMCLSSLPTCCSIVRNKIYMTHSVFCAVLFLESGMSRYLLLLNKIYLIFLQKLNELWKKNISIHCTLKSFSEQCFNWTRMLRSVTGKFQNKRKTWILQTCILKHTVETLGRASLVLLVGSPGQSIDILWKEK